MVGVLAGFAALAAPALARAEPGADGLAILKLSRQIEGELSALLALKEPVARRAAAQAFVRAHVDARPLVARCVEKKVGLTKEEAGELARYFELRVAHRLGRWVTGADGAVPEGPVEIRAGDLSLSKKRATVPLSLRLGGGPPMKAVAHLAKGKAGWRLWDLRTDRLHLVRQYRAQSAALLRQGGVPELMAEIRRRIPLKSRVEAPAKAD